MRAMRFVPLIVAVFLLVPAMPASAHIEALSMGFVIETEGDNDWDSVDVHITCTAGEGFLITAKVTDAPSYVGKGQVKGTCTGADQLVGVPLTNESGTADIFNGSACRRAKAHTKISGIPHDEASASAFC